jgi:hypothetical protein
MRTTVSRSLAAVAAGAALSLTSVGGAAATGVLASAQPEKVYVCKYVGTPGEDERLQTGQNPISVSVNAVAQPVVIGAFFNDAQGRSVVIAFDTGQDEPDVSECPDPPTPTPTETATHTPTETKTHTATETKTHTSTATMTGTHTPTTTKPVTGPVVETDRPGGSDSSQLGLLAGAGVLLAAAGAMALSRRRESAEH